MPSAGAIRAGKAVVEFFADDARLRRAMTRISRRMKTLGTSAAKIGLGVAGSISALSVPVAAASLAAAGRAQETLNKLRAVFGSSAAEAEAFADAVASSVGRSSTDIQDALSTFQAFAVGLGFGRGQAAQMSRELTTLALDLASFHNIADDDAFGRFISAMSGSSEVLDRFGINIRQAALQQELLAMGVRRSWSEITEQEKVAARLAIIARAMGDQGAVGDAVRTAASWTNTTKRLGSAPL
jgi:hypothetical protein